MEWAHRKQIVPVICLYHTSAIPLRRCLPPYLREHSVYFIVDMHLLSNFSQRLRLYRIPLTWSNLSGIFSFGMSTLR